MVLWWLILFAHPTNSPGRTLQESRGDTLKRNLLSHTEQHHHERWRIAESPPNWTKIKSE